MRTDWLRHTLTVGLALAVLTAALAQQPQTPPARQLPPVIPGVEATPATSAPSAQPAATPAQQPAVPPPATVPAQPPAPIPAPRGLDFVIPDGSLTDFIEIVAKKVGFNYILDPAVAGKGSVSLFTYGETKPTDLMTLLQTILRVNGATMVPVGDIYRIVPINKISALPLPPNVNIDQKALPPDERMMLDLIFLKYSTATEIEKLIVPFLGEGASHSIYEAANLLILQDNARNMKRTLALIEMFDSEGFAGQRVRLFDVTNSRPSDLVKDLDTVFKAYAFSDKASAVRFIPVDRISTLIAVAPNPGIFPQVQDWIDKLDIAVKVPAGEVSTYVYRLKYSRAVTTAMAITALYTGNIGSLIALANMTNGNGMGGGMGGGYGGMNYGGQGMGGGGYGMGGGYGGGYGGYGAGGYGQTTGGMIPPTTINQPGSGLPGVAAGANTDLTGSVLAAAGTGQAGGQRIPHVIPNPFDNTLLIQGTPQEWAQIQNLLRQLDVPPRQVLIEMKIYELNLGSAFSLGIQACLENAGTNCTGVGRALNAGTGSGGINLSMGTLVGSARELLGALQASEEHNEARQISAPTIIATDSIPAMMNVGTDVPTLTSQAIAGGVQSGGNSVFSNTVGSQSTGVTLDITARVSPSGVVTMIINQDVSAAVPTTTSSIGSPSFSQRNFSTQLTVQDGDTVAIGGAIVESKNNVTNGVPFLSRIPILGALFGTKSSNMARTELIVFITPKVLWDTNQLQDASDEIRGQMDRIKKMLKDQ